MRGFPVPLLVLLACAAQAIDAECAETVVDNVQPAGPATWKTVDTLDATTGTGNVTLNIPPRYMWGWGTGLDGYCGAFSVQSVALFYGVWVSAELVRRAALNNTTQVLLGTEHFARVARALRLDMLDFASTNAPQPQINAFLNWTAHHIAAGHGVIAGVYERKPRGDADYDHIVPLVGFASGLTPNPHLPGSVATRSRVAAVGFNDLYEPVTRVLSSVGLSSTREGFSQRTDPTQPYSYALPRDVNYGVAIRGLEDPRNETYRLMLQAWSWTEPDWGQEDGCDLKPKPLDLSASVFGLHAGNKYAILRFDGNGSTSGNPSQAFLASGVWSRRWDFVASGETHRVTLFDRVMSDTMVTYRAVLVHDAAATPTPTPTPGSATPPAGHGVRNSNGGLIASRVPLALLVFGGVLVAIGGTWYATKRYWERRNPLYDPHSVAPARRQRTASKIDGTHADEDSEVSISVAGTAQLQEPLTAAIS